MAICKLMSMCIPVLYKRFALLVMCESGWLCLCIPVSIHEVHVLPVYLALCTHIQV